MFFFRKPGTFLLLLLLVMAGLTVAFALLPVPVVARQARTFRIDARQFAYSPSKLKVNPGDTVTVQQLSHTRAIIG